MSDFRDWTMLAASGEEEKMGSRTGEFNLFADMFGWTGSLGVRDELSIIGKDIIRDELKSGVGGEDSDALYEVELGWQCDVTEEEKAFQEYQERQALLIAELSAPESKTPRGRFSYTEFRRERQTAEKLRAAKEVLTQQLEKGASFKELSLRRVPETVAQKMKLEEKEEEEAEEAGLLDALILTDEKQPTSYLFRGVQIDSTTPIRQLQDVAKFVGVKNPEGMKHSELVENITGTIKFMNRFFGNAPEVKDLNNRPILTQKMVRERRDALQAQRKSQKQKGAAMRKKGKKGKDKIKTKKGAGRGSRRLGVVMVEERQRDGRIVSRPVQREEEDEGELGLDGMVQVMEGLDLGDLGLEGDLGLPWFAPVVGGIPYSSAFAHTRENILKILIEQYYTNSVDLQILGRLDPINSILPQYDLTYQEKLKSVDLLFGKRTSEDDKELKDMDEVLKSLLSRTTEEADLRKRQPPDFRHYDSNSKTKIAFQLAKRANWRLGDMVAMEVLLATLPNDVDLNAVDADGKTILMNAIESGTFLDIKNGTADYNPLRMVAIILSASVKYGPRINLNAVDNNGNTALTLIAYKCNELHIQAAKFKEQYSEKAVFEREEKERMERERSSGSGFGSLFGGGGGVSGGVGGSSSTLFGPSSVAPLRITPPGFVGEQPRVEARRFPEAYIDKLISWASKGLHGVLISLLRPDVTVSHYAPESIFVESPAKILSLKDTATSSTSCKRELGLVPADPNYSKKGITFGSICAANGCWVCLNLLTRHAPKTDFTIREDATGMTALDYAVRSDNPIMVATVLTRSNNFFNRNAFNENVFHQAARHEWGMCYKRHPKQVEVIKGIYGESKVKPGEPPSILEMLWKSFEPFLEAFVDVEVNEMARKMVFSEPEEERKMREEGKDRDLDEMDKPSKFLGTSNTDWIFGTPATTSTTSASSATTSTASRFATLDAERKKKLARFQGARLRELTSAVLDGLSSDLVTPLWISGLKRDETSFQFFLDHNADPTVRNQQGPQGITLYQALVDLLPEDTEQERKTKRENIVLALGKAVSEIAMTRRIQESELRQYTMTPEEGATAPSSATGSSTTTTTGTEWQPGVETLVKELMSAVKLLEPNSTPTEKNTRRHLQTFMGSYWDASKCRLDEKGLDDHSRKMHLASRRALARKWQSDPAKGVALVESLLTKIEDMSTDPALCQKLEATFRKEAPFVFEIDQEPLWASYTNSSGTVAGGYAR